MCCVHGRVAEALKSIEVEPEALRSPIPRDITAAMTTPAYSYTHRHHAFAPTRTYWLEQGALCWRDEPEDETGQDTPATGKITFGDISRIHARYHPSRVQRRKYELHVTARNGARVVLTNSSYRGFGDFAVHNEAYTAFARALHNKAAAAKPDIVFTKGNSTGGYIANWLLTIWIFAMIAIALWFFVSIGLIWIAAVKLAIVIFYIPTLIRYLARNRPGSYDPQALPPEILPA